MNAHVIIFFIIKNIIMYVRCIYYNAVNIKNNGQQRPNVPVQVVAFDWYPWHQCTPDQSCWASCTATHHLAAWWLDLKGWLSPGSPCGLAGACWIWLTNWRILATDHRCLWMRLPSLLITWVFLADVTKSSQVLLSRPDYHLFRTINKSMTMLFTLSPVFHRRGNTVFR